MSSLGRPALAPRGPGTPPSPARHDAHPAGPAWGRTNQGRRSTTPCDKNFPSLRDVVEQLRKMRPRFVETHRGHIPALLLTCRFDQSIGKEASLQNISVAGSVLIWGVGPRLASARPPQGAALQSNSDTTQSLSPGGFMRSARGLCGGVPLNSQSSRQTRSAKRLHASEAAWPLQRVGRYTAKWSPIDGKPIFQAESPKAPESSEWLQQLLA